MKKLYNAFRFINLIIDKHIKYDSPMFRFYSEMPESNHVSVECQNPESHKCRIDVNLRQ
jgi:hypothetical protein